MKIKNVVVINDVTNDLNDGKFFYDQKEANIRIQLTQNRLVFIKILRILAAFYIINTVLVNPLIILY